VAYSPKEEKTLKDLLVIQKTLGLNIDWYDKDDFLKIIPALNPDGLVGGTFSPEDGSASPMLSALAFERRAKACGAEFRYKEIVTGIEREKGRICGVVTDQGQYSAGMVVNAAGGYAREVAEMVGVDLPVYPDSHEAGITEPVAPFLKPMVVDIRPVEASQEVPGSANYYFYQHHTGQIVFCITPNPSIWGTDTRETSAFLPQVTRRMLGIMPRLKNIKVRRTWRGLYPMTPDGSPIVGPVEGLQGCYNAAGMCGQGYMLGPGLAWYLRPALLGESGAVAKQAQEVLAPLSINRDFGRKEALK
jgi:sarcosine oxidase subunit beta